VIIRPNSIMFFRERECDKGNIVRIDRTHQRIGGRKIRRNSFKETATTDVSRSVSSKSISSLL
jgi:hypothetical protein